MKEGIPRLPVGKAPKWFFVRQVWFALWGGRFPIRGTDGPGANVKVEWVGGNYEISVVPKGGSSASRWQKPYKELDPSVSVSRGTWVYISPSNPIVLTGLTDLVSAATVRAYPGIWEAAKNVPAKSGSSYNVPQVDFPGGTGTPSGTPLRGDADGDNVFWILITPTCEL